MTDVTTHRQKWMPNWSIHPGAILQEHLEARGLSQAEFARLAGISPELVHAVISGNHPITEETAIRLERVLGLKAYIWTRMQAEWDVFQAHRADTLVSKPTD